MYKYEGFSLDVSIQNVIPYVSVDKISVLRLNRGHTFSLNNPAIIRADPFLFVHENRLYLFYEELHFRKHHGVIKMMSTENLKHWTKPVTITHEPDCHFSFPYVFEDDGDIYMLPETGWQHNIRLYKADKKDLSKFSLHKIIMQRKVPDSNIEYDWCDSCIYKKEGVYYLFTSIKTKATYYLQLFYSDVLEGPYKEHPQSPVSFGDKVGRCAGSITYVDGHLYRFAQDCCKTYGGQVHLLEIDELSPNRYSEHIVKENIIPTSLKFYRHGGHQVNFANFLGHIVVATDAKDDCSFVFERYYLKIKRRLKKK